MSNDYFNHSTNVISNGTRATAAQVNNIAYEIGVGLDKLPTEAHIKRGTINYAADTGSANLYAVSLPYPPASYTDGMEVVFKAANSNTGACSMNVNSLGVKSIKRADGTDPAASEIPANKITTLRYNSTSAVFEIQNGAGYASSAAASATAAANSAAAALVSEGNASASATAAGLSETAAAASAAAALVSENAAAASAALFPNVNASVTASDEELNYADGPNAANKFCLLGSDARVPFAQRPAFRGCLAYKIVSQNLLDGVGSDITFTAEAYDTDSIHSNSSYSSRLTVPAGVTRVRLSASILFSSNSTGSRSVEIRQNGEYGVCLVGAGLPLIIPRVTARAMADYGAFIQVCTPVISVVAGDYFTVWAIQTSGGTLAVSASGGNPEYSYFCMEIVE